MIPEGSYTGRAVAWFLDTGRNGDVTGNVDVEITHGLYSGCRFLVKLWFTEKAAPHAIRALRALGFEGSSLGGLSAPPPEREIVVDIEHETYQGKQRVRASIGGWRPFAPPTPEQVERLSKKCSRLFAQTAARDPDPEPTPFD